MTVASSSEPSGALQAVLFDMDGLLVDTEPQWFAAETATVEQLGGVWGKQQQIDLLGSNLPVAARYMIEHTGSPYAVATVMQMLLENMTRQLTKSIAFQPGAFELLAALSAADIPLALVTSSVRVHVDVVLAQLPTNPFRHQVTADDVENLKPHPEPYLTALGLLGATASQSVVLEDSPAGVNAAEAAGCHVVAVPSVVPIEAAARRHVVESLAEIDLAVLEGLVATTRW
ncbi:MAG: HAD family phosphatase [Actinomycetes bacterium]